MSKITVYVDKLEDCRSQLLAEEQRLQDLIGNLTTVLGQMEATWDGGASRTFIANMQAQVEDLKNTVLAIKDLRKQVKNAKDKWKDVDKYFGGVFEFFENLGL